MKKGASWTYDTPSFFSPKHSFVSIILCTFARITYIDK